MAEQEPELKLKIPLKEVYEEFQCPICFEAVQRCLMTPCGHNFCEACLDECLNRKQKCPCCNTKCTREQCIANHHFNKVAEMLEREREIASKRYFERLLSGGPASGGVAPPNGKLASTPTAAAPFTLRDSQDGLSPIEECFRRHLTTTVLHYQRYCQQLEERVAESADRLREEFVAQLVRDEKATTSSAASSSSKHRESPKGREASSSGSRQSKMAASGSGGGTATTPKRKRAERAKALLDQQLQHLHESAQQNQASLLKVGGLVVPG
jgi:Ring finger domain